MGEPTVPALHLLFDEARHVLEAQMDAVDAFDEKAATLLRFNVLLLGVLVTLVSIVAQLDVRIRGSTFAILGFVAGVASLLVSTLSAIVAYRNLQWNIGVRAESLRGTMGYEADERTILRAGLSAYTRAMTHNASRIDEALDWLDRALATLMLGLLLLSGSSIVLWMGTFP